MSFKKWICALIALVLMLSLLPGQALAVETGPAPAQGTHPQWIDRIANLPDYAQTFYTWLEDNATAEGALADPSQGIVVGGKYVHLVHTIKNTVQFDYPAGEDLKSLAMNAALEDSASAYDAALLYVFDVYGAFDKDHPEVFWLSGASTCGAGISYSYGSRNGQGWVEYDMQIYFYLQSDDFDVRSEDYRDPALIAEAIEARNADIDEILADCPMDAPAVVQIRYLNQKLTKINAYNSAVAWGSSDDADQDAWECTSALAGSSGVEGPVCEGYARAFKVLCDRLEIPCVLAEGYARSSTTNTLGAHMWNEVELDGSWYAVDVTWNDPTVSSLPDTVVSGYERERWLLLGSQTQVATGLTYEQSHVAYNTLGSGMGYTNGPLLAADAYTIPDNLMDVAPFRSGETYTAPQKDGYIFAGWYTDAALTQPMSRDCVTGWAYAKFVDADTLTVKFQLSSGTNASSATTDLRLLTGVDSLNYRNVVFMVTIQGKTAALPCTAAYEKIVTGDSVIGDASEVFGSDARYFVVYTLTGARPSMYELEITVSPCWETLDGTVVNGMARTLRICDGFSGE